MSRINSAERIPPAHLQAGKQSRSYDRSHTRAEALRSWLSRLPSFLSDMLCYAQIVRAELRSLSNRICALRDRNSHFACFSDVLELGPLFELDAQGEYLQLCKETFARNESIERISAKYPWVSAGDTLLFLEGWEMGKQFALHSACNKNKETEQPLHPFA